MLHLQAVPWEPWLCLGSAPIAAAAAHTKEPVRQGLVSMTGIFIDTPNHTCTINQYSHRNLPSFSFSNKLPAPVLAVSNSYLLKKPYENKTVIPHGFFFYASGISLLSGLSTRFSISVVMISTICVLLFLFGIKQFT